MDATAAAVGLRLRRHRRIPSPPPPPSPPPFSWTPTHPTQPTTSSFLFGPGACAKGPRNPPPPTHPLTPPTHWPRPFPTSQPHLFPTVSTCCCKSCCQSCCCSRRRLGAISESRTEFYRVFFFCFVDGSRRCFYRVRLSDRVSDGWVLHTRVFTEFYRVSLRRFQSHRESSPKLSLRDLSFSSRKGGSILGGSSRTRFYRVFFLWFFFFLPSFCRTAASGSNRRQMSIREVRAPPHPTPPPLCGPLGARRGLRSIHLLKRHFTEFFLPSFSRRVRPSLDADRPGAVPGFPLAFPRILPGFTGFYWVLLGFSRPSFIRRVARSGRGSKSIEDSTGFSRAFPRMLPGFYCLFLPSFLPSFSRRRQGFSRPSFYRVASFSVCRVRSIAGERGFTEFLPSFFVTLVVVDVVAVVVVVVWWAADVVAAAAVETATAPGPILMTPH